MTLIRRPCASLVTLVCLTALLGGLAFAAEKGREATTPAEPANSTDSETRASQPAAALRRAC